MSQVEIVYEDDRWSTLELGQIIEDSFFQVLTHFKLPKDQYFLSVLACSDARISDLNSEFRDKPSSTNVLSWPSRERGAQIAGDMPQALNVAWDDELGDIAIAYDTCLKEARELHKTFEHHVTHLVIHGILHLMGFDHIRDQDATLMEEIEIQILGKMGINNPY